MKRHLKLWLSLLVFSVLLAGAFGLVKTFISAHVYYGQIQTQGRPYQDTSANGHIYTYYRYRLVSYDRYGHMHRLTFIDPEDRPLPLKSWVRLTYVPRKDVVRWQKIAVTKVPKIVRTQSQSSLSK